MDTKRHSINHLFIPTINYSPFFEKGKSKPLVITMCVNYRWLLLCSIINWFVSVDAIQRRECDKSDLLSFLSKIIIIAQTQINE
jgi:hypothetical protein